MLRDNIILDRIHRSTDRLLQFFSSIPIFFSSQSRATPLLDRRARIILRLRFPAVILAAELLSLISSISPSPEAARNRFGRRVGVIQPHNPRIERWRVAPRLRNGVGQDNDTVRGATLGNNVALSSID